MIQPGLLIFLIILSTAVIYWLFRGKRKFEEKMYPPQGQEDEKEVKDDRS